MVTPKCGYAQVLQARAAERRLGPPWHESLQLAARAGPIRPGPASTFPAPLGPRVESRRAGAMPRRGGAVVIIDTRRQALRGRRPGADIHEGKAPFLSRSLSVPPSLRPSPSVPPSLCLSVSHSSPSLPRSLSLPLAPCSLSPPSTPAPFPPPPHPHYLIPPLPPCG